MKHWITRAGDELTLSLTVQVDDGHVDDGRQVGERLHDDDVRARLVWLDVEFHQLRVAEARADEHDAVVQVRHTLGDRHLVGQWLRIKLGKLENSHAKNMKI